MYICMYMYVCVYIYIYIYIYIYAAEGDLARRCGEGLDRVGSAVGLREVAWGAGTICCIRIISTIIRTMIVLSLVVLLLLLLSVVLVLLVVVKSPRAQGQPDLALHGARPLEQIPRRSLSDLASDIARSK